MEMKEPESVPIVKSLQATLILAGILLSWYKYGYERTKILVLLLIVLYGVVLITIHTLFFIRWSYREGSIQQGLKHVGNSARIQVILSLILIPAILIYKRNDNWFMFYSLFLPALLAVTIIILDIYSHWRIGNYIKKNKLIDSD